MGEIAEMMLDGTLCMNCGEYLGGDEGYPVSCGCDGSGNSAHTTMRTNRWSGVKTPRRIKYKACAAPKCFEQIPSRKHACDHHWQMLPEHLRKQIKYAYRERSTNSGPMISNAQKNAKAFWKEMQKGPTNSVTNNPKAVSNTALI